MNDFELFDLKEKVESRVNQYWTYWTVIVVAVGGWIFSKISLDDFQLVVLMLGLIVFFIANFYMILSSTELAMALKDEIKHGAEVEKYRSSKLYNLVKKDNFSFRLRLSIFLHIGSDLVVIIVLINKLCS